MRWTAVAGAVSAGLVVGSLARNLPLQLALAIIPSADAGPCGMEETLSCAVENVPTALGKVIQLGILVVVLCAVLAALGAVSIGLGGLHMRRLARRRLAPLDVPPQDGPDWRGLGLVGLGSSLVAPGGWLLGSFLLFLAQ